MRLRQSRCPRVAARWNLDENTESKLRVTQTTSMQNKKTKTACKWECVLKRERASAEKAKMESCRKEDKKNILPSRLYWATLNDLFLGTYVLYKSSDIQDCRLSCDKLVLLFFCSKQQFFSTWTIVAHLLLFAGKLCCRSSTLEALACKPICGSRPPSYMKPFIH